MCIESADRPTFGHVPEKTTVQCNIFKMYQKTLSTLDLGPDRKPWTDPPRLMTDMGLDPGSGVYELLNI